MLADQSARPVSTDRVADLHRGGNSYAPRRARGDDGHGQQGGDATTASLQNRAELVALSDPAVSAKMVSARGHGGASALSWPRSRVGGGQAPRRCLPLARRLLITSLPPRDL